MDVLESRGDLCMVVVGLVSLPYLQIETIRSVPADAERQVVLGE